MPSSATTTEAKKIQRQPKFCATKPPKSEQKPEPPQEPIDHMLTARWRASPSQKVLTNARLAGMMQAPDRPCSARPDSRKYNATAPPGAKPINSDPIILSTKPAITILTRPIRSAKPPMKTMKMPENSAVMATAIFIRLVSSPRSFCMSGAMFSVVWANSQKVSTPIIMPKSNLSFPLNPVAASAGPAEGSRALVIDEDI